MKTAIIVGSGLAGLTASHYLKKAGWPVRVLESADRIGGRVSCVEANGYRVDDGPTAVSTSYRRYVELLHELGLSTSITDSSNVIGFVRNGVVHEFDGGHPLRSFINTRLLSWREKIQLGLGMLRVVKDARGVRIATGVDGERFDTESIEAYLQRYFSPALISSFFDPLVHCFTYGDKREASCVEMFAGLDSASGKLINVLGGLELLPRALAAQVPVQLNARVTGVAKRDGKVVVDHVDADGQGHSEVADACIITSTFQQAAELYPALQTEGPALLAQTRVAPSFAVYLGYGKATHSKVAAITLPESEFPLVPAIFLDHNKAPDRAPPGHSLITVYYSSAAVPQLKLWSEQQMFADAQQLVLRFFPELQGSLDLQMRRLFDPASHLAPVGHFKAVRQFLDRHAVDDPVQLAGDYFSIPSQETAVEWGYRAARNLLRLA